MSERIENVVSQRFRFHGSFSHLLSLYCPRGIERAIFLASLPGDRRGHFGEYFFRLLLALFRVFKEVGVGERYSRRHRGH